MSLIKSRLVLHFPGFEPLTARQHYERFVRESDKFSELWQLQQSDKTFDENNDFPGWKVSTKGPHWEVETEIRLMEWGSRLNHPWPGTYWRKVIGGSRRYFAHFKTAAPWRYIGANWRFAGYFFYPLISIILYVLAAIMLAFASKALLSVFADWVMPGWIFWSLASGLFLLIFRYLGERWSFPLVFDVMHYTHALGCQADPVSLERIETFSRQICEIVAETQAEEIVFTTHSTGSAFAAGSLAAALRKAPDLLDHKKLIIVATASNMPKIGLLSEANWLRRDLGEVLAHPNIQWCEVFAGEDALCFFKHGPDNYADQKPVNAILSKRVRFSKMISKERFKRIRWRFFRVHRQLILANEFRYFYDFYSLLYAPVKVVDALGAKKMPDR